MLTNPFAHAVATALVLDGSDGERPPSRIELELFRANDIEADDTSCLRLLTASGTPLVVAATLCAAEPHEPTVTVYGERGEIELRYKRGHVRLLRTDRAGVEERTLGGTDLLENLLAHLRRPELPLLCPLPATRAFTHVLEAVRTAPEPTPIPAGDWVERRTAGVPRRMVRGVDAVIARAARELALFSELPVSWARPAAVPR